MEKWQNWVRILLDTNSSDLSGRDDAAMYLADSDEPEAFSSLALVGSDLATPKVLAWSCGESLGEIWCRRGQVDHDVFMRLTPPAQQEAKDIIKARRPDLL